MTSQKEQFVYPVDVQSTCHCHLLCLEGCIHIPYACRHKHFERTNAEPLHNSCAEETLEVRCSKLSWTPFHIRAYQVPPKCSPPPKESNQQQKCAVSRRFE